MKFESKNFPFLIIYYFCEIRESILILFNISPRTFIASETSISCKDKY